MLIDAARIVVQAFGLMIGLLSLWGMVAPDKLIKLVSNVATNPNGLPAAVTVRVVMGAALLVAAEAARFPTTFMVLGWIVIAAAVGLLIMGSARMQKLVEWVGRWPQSLVRIWLVFGAIFGAFLVYGA